MVAVICSMCLFSIRQIPANGTIHHDFVSEGIILFVNVILRGERLLILMLLVSQYFQ